MTRVLSAAGALLILGLAAPQTADAAPSFPLDFLGSLTDNSGLGLFTGTITGDVSLDDPDGVKPYGGSITLQFIINYQQTSMTGDWTFGGGLLTGSVPDSEILNALGPLIPFGVEVSNATFDGVWNKPIKCVEGSIYADVTFFGIPLGNIVVADHTMCR